MKVLVCHNFYQQPGGEDQVFLAEMALLREMGDEVIQFTRDNKAVEEIDSAAVAVSAVWSRETYDALRTLVRRERPSIVHFHNTFPLMSPSAYYAARAEGAAVVQTLHNYRLLCPAATFFRDGHVCEDCLGKAVPWPGVVHSCYRSSPRASAAVAAILTVHHAAQTWTRAVDRFIALTEFSRRKFVEGGLPAARIAVKPNFVHPEPQPGAGGGGFGVFVGRLSAEKGIDTMLAAWKLLPRGIKLKIVGDGPLTPKVREAAGANPDIELLGRCEPDDVFRIVGEADFLVFPSLWYEGQPRTIVEAFALGTPVIASSIGSMVEMIDYGRNGLHFRTGDPADLAGQITRLTANPDQLRLMRTGARAAYDAKYTAAKNYSMLLDIYATARANYEATVPAEVVSPAPARSAYVAPVRRASSKLSVLLAHNFYRLPGGEDNVFADEARLLEENGHEVHRFLRDNKNVDEIDTASVAAGAVWSRESYAALRAKIREHRPDVVHFHNTFPLMSPAAYYAARAEGAAVVQTLHNYRLLCPSATFFRDGRVCEDCLGKVAPWPGVVHACYRGSVGASAAVAAMLTIHGLAHTWERAVDRYIALTDFSRQKFIDGGLPAERIMVKPNFVAPDPGPGEGRGGFALFVGTLVDGKGVATMLKAWERLSRRFRSRSSGMVRWPMTCAASHANPSVQYLGRRPLDEVYATMRDAAFLLFPSHWYEGLPKTIVEAFACGTPVLASKLGAMANLIEHERNGLHFRAGDVGDVAAQVGKFMSEADRQPEYRRAARATYLGKYTPQANYRMLQSVYASAIQNYRQTSPRGRTLPGPMVLPTLTPVAIAQ